MNREARVGEQGVHLVIAELIGRGLLPYRPVVDDHGVDLMLLNGTRIQVKSANLSDQHGRDGSKDGRRAYQFSLQKTIIGTNDKLKSVGITYEYRNLGKEADFLILVGLDEKLFWIVPTYGLEGCSHISIAKDKKFYRKSERIKFHEAVRHGLGRWDLLRSDVFVSRTDPVAVVNTPTALLVDSGICAEIYSLAGRVQ